MASDTTGALPLAEDQGAAGHAGDAAGPTATIEAHFVKFCATHGEKIYGVIWHTAGCILGREGVKDALQETLLGTWRWATTPAGAVACLQPFEAGLLPVARAIAGNVAMQAWRHWYREDEAREVLKSRTRQSDFWVTPPETLNPEEQRRLWQDVRDIMATGLSDLQRTVAVRVVRCYEESGDRTPWAEMAQDVSELTGRPETADTVKGAWRQARLKLRNGLVERGWQSIIEAGDTHERDGGARSEGAGARRSGGLGAPGGDQGLS
jgi:hypothetical protein